MIKNNTFQGRVAHSSQCFSKRLSQYSSVYTYFGSFSSVYTYFGMCVHSLVSPTVQYFPHMHTGLYIHHTSTVSYTRSCSSDYCTALTSLIGIQHWLIPVQDVSPLTPVDSWDNFKPATATLLVQLTFAAYDWQLIHSNDMSSRAPLQQPLIQPPLLFQRRQHIYCANCCAPRKHGGWNINMLANCLPAR